MFLQIGGVPNIEGDEKSAYNNVQVGERGPNTEGDEKSAYNNVQVGELGPNTEGDEKSAYNNVSWGTGPNIENFKKKFLQTMQVGEQRNKFYENIISIPLLRITT